MCGEIAKPRASSSAQVSVSMRGAAAHHDAIVARVEAPASSRSRNSLPDSIKRRETAVIRMRLAGDRRVVVKFLAHQLAEESRVGCRSSIEVLHDRGLRGPSALRARAPRARSARRLPGSLMTLMKGAAPVPGAQQVQPLAGLQIVQ